MGMTTRRRAWASRLAWQRVRIAAAVFALADALVVTNLLTGPSQVAALAAIVAFQAAVWLLIAVSR